MLQDILRTKKQYFSDTADTELRAQVNRTRRVVLVGGNVVGNSRSETSGVCARVYKNGVYGFSSIAEYDDESVTRVLRAAAENAAFMGEHAGRGKTLLPRIPAGERHESKDINDPEQKLYFDSVKAIDSYIALKYPGLTGRTVLATADSAEKLLCVSNGFDSHAFMPRSYIYVIMNSETESGEPVDTFEVFGGFGTFDLNFSDISFIYEKIDRQYETLMEKRRGVYPEGGIQTCILNGFLTGMLSHEAVGHTVEADLVLGGSVAGHCLGKRVASEKVTLVDFANTAFGAPAPLPVYVDDEGVKAEDAVLIKDGILTGYMNSRETVEHFSMKPQGNARAFSFSDEPLVRMRNTAILPGTDKFDEMIASVKNGYLFNNSNNGQADTTGEFMFGVTGGYEIKNGKLGRPLLDSTISGVAFEMLKTVDMVSDEISWVSSGMCGKKQPMPVGMGGPALRCKVMVGGK